MAEKRVKAAVDASETIKIEAAENLAKYKQETEKWFRDQK